MSDQNFDRISYALGLSMGNNFRASGIETINVADFADGVAAVFSGKDLKMTYDEAKEEIRKYFHRHAGAPASRSRQGRRTEP